MASPFTWFRKYEKLLLGIFGVVLIVAFTVSLGTGVDPIVDYLSGGGSLTSRPAADAVVSWKHGQISAAEFQSLRRSRNLLKQFMIGVIQTAAKRGAQPQVFPISGDTSDPGLLQQMLLAREAEKMGIVVTDDSILRFLDRVVEGKMAPADFAALWKDVTRGAASDRQLLALLRSELMAQRLHQMAWNAGAASSPVQTWDFFNRLERRIEAELVPFAVEDYLAQVPEPEEQTLRDLYEKYKDAYPDALASEPGFRRRERMALDYIKFEFDQFLNTELASVSEDEVKQYYEENKDEFIDDSLPASDLDAPATSPPDAGPSGREGNNEGGAAEASPPPPTPIPAEPQQDKDQEQAPDEVADAKDDAPLSEAGDDELPTETEKRYKPLPEVRDQIRRTIAAPRAQKHMQELIGRVGDRMDTYYRQYIYWNLQRRKQPDLELPEPPTFDDLASDPGILVESIPLSDRFELTRYELGQEFELEFVQEGVRQIPFPTFFFGANLPLFQARVFPSGEVARKFVFWKTSEEAAYTPEFDEVRDEVIRAWKFREARRLALAAANHAAQEATANGTRLEECLASKDRVLIQTGEITWMTGGSVPLEAGAQPRLVTIPGVPDAGRRMIHRLFRLPIGQIDVLANHPQNTYFVARVAKVVPTLEIRREEFFETGVAEPGLLSVAQGENQRLLAEWYEGLLKEYEVTWLREPQSAEQL
jgi:hypothetical protein